WIDLSTVPEAHRTAVIDAAVHSRIAGVVADDPALLDDLPPTITRVLRASGPVESPHLVTVTVDDQDQLDGLSAAFVEVSDDRTLKLACAAAERLDHTVVAFTDPTKIPLEIVIAAADGAPG